MSGTASRRVADLCQRFDYPPPVCALLQGLADAVEHHLGPLGLRSLLLVGSAARGELTWLPAGKGRLEMLSDIDAAVFTRRRDLARVATLRSALHELTATFPANPLFHVDAGIHRLYMKRRTIWTFEAQTTGVVLLGEDLRSRMPVVRPNTVDLGNTAELLLVRVANQAIHTPADVVMGTASARTRLIFDYVTARNALELPTILLPHLGVLVAGYQARDAWLRAHPIPAPELGEGFATLCHAAWATKRDPLGAPWPSDGLSRMLGHYRHLAAYLASRADPSEPSRRDLQPSDASLDGALDRAMTESPVLRVRRAALELGLRARSLRRGDWRRALRYGRPAALRLGLALHEALAARLAGGEAGSALATVHELAVQLGYQRATGGSWADEWLALRRWFVELYGEILFKGNQATIEGLLTSS